jgi:hypothetical protein
MEYGSALDVRRLVRLPGRANLSLPVCKGLFDAARKSFKCLALGVGGCQGQR